MGVLHFIRQDVDIPEVPTMRDTIRQWMREQMEANPMSAMQLASAAHEEFKHVIGINQFVWNDAQNIHDWYELVRTSRHYA